MGWLVFQFDIDGQVSEFVIVTRSVFDFIIRKEAFLFFSVPRFLHINFISPKLGALLIRTHMLGSGWSFLLLLLLLLFIPIFIFVPVLLIPEWGFATDELESLQVDDVEGYGGQVLWLLFVLNPHVWVIIFIIIYHALYILYDILYI